MNNDDDRMCLQQAYTASTKKAHGVHNIFPHKDTSTVSDKQCCKSVNISFGSQIRGSEIQINGYGSRTQLITVRIRILPGHFCGEYKTNYIKYEIIKNYKILKIFLKISLNFDILYSDPHFSIYRSGSKRPIIRRIHRIRIHNTGDKVK